MKDTKGEGTVIIYVSAAKACDGVFCLALSAVL